MALITCKDVSLGYEGTPVVENMSFRVERGDYLCVVGENGSGKTTLMQALLGLRSPLSGSIVLGEGLERSQFGYLPQQTELQKDFPASVREIVLSGCLNSCGLRPFYSKRQRRIARENMERLDILDLANCCYRELSGGQKQRVLLARALCATSRLLLMDEPTSGLDPKVSAQMYAQIEHLNKKHGITVIMISHDLSAAIKYASHVLHVAHEPLFFGTVQDYLDSPVGKSYVGGALNV